MTWPLYYSVKTLFGHTFTSAEWMITCKTEGKAITTTNSWSVCASSRCFEVFPRSSSRVLRGNGGSCSARSPSWFSLCPARGTSIPSGYSNRIDRNMPLRKRPASRCLSPFGDGMQQLLSSTSLRASKQTMSPRVYIHAVTWSPSLERKRWLWLPLNVYLSHWFVL